LLAKECGNLVYLPAYMKTISSDDMQHIALGAGSLVLENGGETYRAEETVVRVAKALGAKEADAFVTPTVVIFSYIDEAGHHHSAMHRVLKRGTNLRKIAQVNDLSRRLETRGKLSNAKQIETIIARISSSPNYPTWLIVLMAAASSASFTLMFGGNAVDAACAFAIGLVLRLMLCAFDKIPGGLNGFIISLLSGALISVMADLVGLTPLHVATATVMIGTLMQVVPGLALVNAIRDIISGDLVSGAARLLDACMTAAGLSIGSVTGVLVSKGVMQLLRAGGIA